MDERILCIHGGLSPDIRTIDQIRVLSRAQDPPNEGAYCGKHFIFWNREMANIVHWWTIQKDLLWSDPDEAIQTWSLSPRGCGFLFGSLVTAQFTQMNNLELIARAHQLVEEGYQYKFNDKSVSSWSISLFRHTRHFFTLLEFKTLAWILLIFHFGTRLIRFIKARDRVVSSQLLLSVRQRSCDSKAVRER